MTTAEQAEVLEKASEHWHESDIAAKYSRAESATRPYAEIMVQKAGIDKLEGEANVLDLACGSGAVTAAIYKALPKQKWDSVKVLGGDISQGMLDYLKARGKKEGWKGLETKIVDGTNIQLEKNSFTHLFINFGIFVLPPSTLSACHSLLRPGGFIAISTWVYFPWYPLISHATSQLPNPPTIPTEAEVDSMIHAGHAWNTSEFVEQVLKDAGFTDVETVKGRRSIDCGTPQQFTDTMWMPLQLFAAGWDEGKKHQLVKDVTGELRKTAAEHAGGEDKHFFMDFEAIVGTGRKAE